MGKKIYKYFSAGVLEIVFSKPGHCGIKCSYPKDYNDPYELFLGVDLTVSADMLAGYSELIRELPQHPTSCFSTSPVVTPMWAHYASNHSGFVIEFDVDAIKDAFEHIIIRDVTYRDKPNEAIASQLAYAMGTKKPRHVYFLQQAVLGSAYFSKDVCWGYERECRLLDQEEYCEEIGGNLILQLPIACCTSIIVGKNATVETDGRTKAIADTTGLTWFKEIIGRSSPQPHMVAADDTRFVFDGAVIAPAEKICESCAEPIVPTDELCPWCSITEADAFQAAQGNPLRMLDRHGMLEDYYKGLENIARGSNRKA